MGADYTNGHDPRPGDWHTEDLGAWATRDTGTDAGPDTGTAGGQTGQGGHGAAEREGPWTLLRLSEHAYQAPEAALAGFLAPDAGSMSVLFGDGGAGKGMLAALWTAQLTAAGQKVLVVDAEGHVNEWYRRILGLGGNLELVAYGGHTGGPMQLELLEGLEAYALIVVDSAAYFGSEEAHDEWAAGAVAMQGQAKLAGVPMLVLAHVSKSQPDKAYGSGFWHNAPRASYRLSREEDGVVLECRKATDLAGLDVGQKWSVALALEEDGITPSSLSIGAYTEAPSDTDVMLSRLQPDGGPGRAVDELTRGLELTSRQAQKLLKDDRRVIARRAGDNGARDPLLYWLADR